jgi:hypothetical protein
VLNFYALADGGLAMLLGDLTTAVQDRCQSGFTKGNVQ